VNCHTWYSHFGGILAKLNYHIPMFLTVHSLEPLRPWKREKLGYGYDCSSWLEKTATEMADAVIAVSEETRRDILRLFNVDPDRVRIIYNGIDPEEYYPRKERDQVEKQGIDPNKPFILFVGRIARQKGIIHLVNAIKYLEPGFQVVLCAGAPDTPEIAEEMKRAVAEAQSKREGVIWIEKMVPKEVAYQLYSHSAVFCCPSIYEPFGIINLEAMACETAVVASAVGGIKEVVVDGETGFLVPLEQMQESPFEPVDPDKFSRDFAEKINLLMRDEPLRRRFGEAGRKRAVEKFSWATIAAETKRMYESLLG
jgi:glycogen synthase